MVRVSTKYCIDIAIGGQLLNNQIWVLVNNREEEREREEVKEEETERLRVDIDSFDYLLFYRY